MKNKLYVTLVLAITVINLNSQTKKIVKETPKQINTCEALQKENDSLKKTLELNTPITTVNSNDFEFTLTKVKGDLKTQMVTFEVLITNNSINRTFNFIKENINVITLEGDALKINDYKLPSSISDHFQMIVKLSTNVPTKCTFTFGELLPSNKYIKLLKLNYCIQGKFEDVEFKDTKIEWK